MKCLTKMNKALLGKWKGVILLVTLILYLSFVPSVLAVALEPGDLIVADFNGAFGGPVGSPAGGRIIKVDPSTGAQTMISSGNLLDGPVYVAIDAAGNIIVLDQFDNQVIKVNPADGSQIVISEDGLFDTPYGIAIDAAGKIIVADVWYGGTGGILKVDPVTGAQTVISSGGSILGPSDVTIDAAGNLYVTSSVPGTSRLRVIRVNPANGDQTVISSGTFSTWYAGIVIDDSTGNIFVAELYYYNGVIKVDPLTGAQTFLARGYPFQDPYQLDIDLSGNLVAADTNWFGAGKIIRVDPASGAKTTISSGGLLVDPGGIVVYEWQQPSNRPPVADAGPDRTVEQDSHAGASVTLDGSGSDDPDDDPLTYSWTWAGGSTTGVNPAVILPLGTTTVTLTVSDGELSDTDTVDITVVDTTPPEITCPADVTVEQESYDGTVVPLEATATDICDPNPVITSDELDIYPLGETVVTFTATDASGNIASCSMTVTVVDTTPPTIELFEPDPSVLWAPNHKFVEVVILGIAGDICDADLAIDVSVKVIDAEGGDGGPTHEPDYEILAVGIEEGEISILVALRAERSGHGDGRIYEITATVTDDSGNTATDTVDVIVPHDKGKGKGKK